MATPEYSIGLDLDGTNLGALEKGVIRNLPWMEQD
jgi:hypothetical protein